MTERSRWHRWWPFVLLVLIAASRWMLAAARPEADSTATSRLLGCVWAALLSLLVVNRQASAWKDWRGMVAGAMLLGGPALGILAGGRDFDPSSLTIALALTSIAIAVAAAATGTGSDGVTGRIWPGLAAVAGFLLILPQPGLSNLQHDALLVLAPVLTGVGAVLFCIDAPELSRRVTSALLGATILFALGWAGNSFAAHLTASPPPSASVLAVACDGLLTFLAVLSLSRLGATRWSAQFSLVPFLILLEGIVLAHVGITTRWAVGLVLIAFASIYLLLPHQEEL